VGSPAPRLVRSDSWLDSVLESFQDWQLNQEISPKTVRSYGIAIKSLFAFLRENGVDDLSRVDRRLLQDWQTHLRARVPPLRSASRASYATAARQLIRYAAERDIVPWELERAIVGVRARRQRDNGPHEREPVSDEHLAKLMAYLAPMRPRMTVIDLRDRALFFFLLYTGLRVSEALQVLRSNFIRGRVRQKGGTWVEYDLSASDAVIGYINDYLRARRDSDLVLWRKHGNNATVGGVLDDSGVREIWHRLCLRVGVPYFTTHQLRHTAGTQVYEQTGDERAVAEWLHHADTRTAYRYAKVSKRKRRNIAEGMADFIDEATARAAMLRRKSPPGGRPRYR
jgi:integrase